MFLGSNAPLWWFGEAVAQPPEDIGDHRSAQYESSAELIDDLFGDTGVASERIETALDVEVEAGVR